VSEALWKEKPVAFMQFPEPYHKNLFERGEFSGAGREHVRKHFLLPRLVRDKLRLKQVVQAT
jgi:trehalose synthase